MANRLLSIIVLWGAVATAFGLSSGAPAADWPMWRCDAEHTAVSPEALAPDLSLRWVRALPRPRPAWPPTQEKLQFDLAYSPVAMGKTLFVPSMDSDRLAAYDTETGAEKWRFYADGPVRFAPVAWKDKVFFVSDDGYLYCLNAQTGAVVWKFRGGPSERKLLGNDRLISTWPARGAPVLRDGTIYFAASIWPFMGTFIHALDAETGKVVWSNTGSGSIFILQQHSSPAFAGVAPQGYIAATADKLLIAGGRTVPAAYDRKTGGLLYYNLEDRTFGKDSGGYAVAALGDAFFNLRMPGQSEPSGAMYQLSNGAPMAATEATVLAKGAMVGVENGQLIAWTAGAEKEAGAGQGAKGKGGKKKVSLSEAWKAALPDGVDRAFLMAGSRVYCGGKGVVVAVETPSASGGAAKIAWKAQIEGDAYEAIAADGKLLVSTREGGLYCFGVKAAGELKRYDDSTPKPFPSSDSWKDKARAILEKTGATEGYCLAFGWTSSNLAAALARQSKLHVILLDPDAAKIGALRNMWDGAGLHGDRLAALAGDTSTPVLPPYMASLVVSVDPHELGLDKDTSAIQSLYRSLRPYGGAACLFVRTAEAQDAFEKTVKAAALENAQIAKTGEFVTLTRAGALPGAADWTHQYADAGNTVTSKDSRVQAPLGLLWFGGPSHAGILPRHGHGPAPQVVGGRLFIEGPDLLRAVDVYTGRMLWEAPFKGLGDYFNNTNHQPGANETGSNFVSAPDAIYVAYGTSIVRLDPATGARLGEFKLPASQGGEAPNCGYLGVSGDLLVAGASPIHFSLPRAASADDEEGAPKKKGKAAEKAATAQKGKGKAKQAQAGPKATYNAPRGQDSQRLAGLNRHTGAVLWTCDAAYAFRHNAIALGGGKVFCIDGLTQEQLDALQRRGDQPQGPSRLLALDAKTGKEAWSAKDGVFGTWLAYSPERDVVLEAGSRFGDRAPDEAGKGMAVYRAATGERLWQKDMNYQGPCIIRHDAIITQTGGPTLAATPARSYSLLTGEAQTRLNPLTGETIPWNWLRFKGCNTAVASEHLLTFRSAAACYVDLETGQGTVSLGGFKSGCTSNLIVADGVLNAPDYTRTCICAYQNQASLALVPAADDPSLKGCLEAWSFDYYPAPKAPMPAKRFGLNFAASGNHFGPDGTLWLEVPSVGGPSPDVPVQFEPAKPELLRRHASLFPNDELNWIASSGVKGISKITIRPFLQPAPPAGGAGKKGAAKKGAEEGAAAKETVNAFDRNAFTVGDAADETAPGGRFEKPCLYTVRLYFAELEDRKPGERVFSVLLQGKPVLTDFDVAGAAGGAAGGGAGGAKRSIVKEFKGIAVTDNLEVSFQPKNGAQPLLCGLQAIAE